MPTARYGELARHAFIADCDGAVQVSNPRPTNVPGCGATAATAGAGPGTTDQAATATTSAASRATVLRISPPPTKKISQCIDVREGFYHESMDDGISLRALRASAP
ncbi:hypothetical protein Asi02nite_38910 [Asanoa siamensis]|uniref:Uncharacterized protein n=1 Tax=Asanoa siamensis TaxID=926357 RepID=A0ABQ4CSX7_9ACTN|nr:hypothetical protein Asi02nite_38910 [Asanoa siamensis]